MRHELLWLALLVAAIWLPRGLGLNRFVAIDERKWLVRSGNFYQALAHGDYTNTIQQQHPGVTTTWAGAAGFVWRYPAYAREAPGQLGSQKEEIEPFLRAHGHEPLELLAAGRAVMVLLVTALLLVTFLAARRLLGWWPALVGFLLIAFDPFHLALSRLLHLDGLLSGLVLLSALAFLNYLYRGRSRSDLLLSAVAAGLAWLTKSPGLFVIPFVGLLALGAASRELRVRSAAGRDHVTGLREALRGSVTVLILPLFLWVVVASAAFVLFWPAMWVDPLGTLREVFDGAFSHADRGHPNSIFFGGQVILGDPGPHFYPVTYLWRTTPTVLLGLLLALVAFVRRSAPLHERVPRITIAALALFALLFAVFMSLGAKKFDRYLLPVYAPLDLVAAAGWVAGAGWLRSIWERRRRTEDAGRSGPQTSQASESSEVSAAAPRTQLTTDHGPVTPGGRRSAVGGLSIAVLGVAIALQMLVALPTFPYYLTYYNPLLGGGAKAYEVMLVGWGEGLDQAARYLNAKPDAERLTAMSGEGPFSYLFEGQTKSWHFSPDLNNIRWWVTTDYAVVYSNDWQRRISVGEVGDYFKRQTPEHTIHINGIPYARIYDMRGKPPPDFVTLGRPRYTDWGDRLRLVSYELPETSVAPGESFLAVFYLQALAPLDRDLNVLLRVVGADGRELARQEGWPFGTPTSTLKARDVVPDGHDVVVSAGTPPGYYRVELSFYDPATLESLPATDVRTGAQLGAALVVDYVAVGQVAPAPDQALNPPPLFGELVSLTGAAIGTLPQVSEPAAGSTAGGSTAGAMAAAPGDTLNVRLFWRAERALEKDYTAFVHVVGPNGALVAQDDQQPLDGFFPTSFWRPGQGIGDDYTLTLPVALLPGSYEMRAGMYDLASGQRLPASQGGEPAGDSVAIGSIQVE